MKTYVLISLDKLCIDVTLLLCNQNLFNVVMM